MPSAVLLAALLAADGVRFVVVGSAALWLRGWSMPVGDLDVVADLDDANVAMLRASLGSYQTGGSSRLAGAARSAPDVWTAQTVFATVDVLVERARADGPALRRRAGPVSAADAEVTVASASDAWALRRRFKTTRDVVGAR